MLLLVLCIPACIPVSIPLSAFVNTPVGTLDNTIVEKQLGFGNNFATIYVGETDAQRIGFAKTSKIGAPTGVIFLCVVNLAHFFIMIKLRASWYSSAHANLDHFGSLFQ